MVSAAPSTLNPPPAVVRNYVFVGQSVVDLTNITFGARVEVGPFVNTSFPTYAFFADIGGALGRPLAASDSLVMQEKLGALSSSTSTLVPRPCTELPNPQPAAPRAGTDTVSFTDYVFGSTLRVISSTNVELADGSGPVIRATRNFVSGEVVRMTQEFPTCRASRHFQIRVP